MAEELVERALEAVETARKSNGKLRKGSNEVTKALEKGTAKLVLTAGDVNPKEIVMHLPILAKEKGIPCIEVPAKVELGAAAGIPVGTAAVAIVEEGDAKAIIKSISEKSQ